MKKSGKNKHRVEVKDFAQALVFGLFEGVNASNVLQENYKLDINTQANSQEMGSGTDVSFQQRANIEFLKSGFQKAQVSSLKISVKTILDLKADKKKGVKIRLRNVDGQTDPQHISTIEVSMNFYKE